MTNHLNDIAKDHPALVAAWIEAHLPDASPERQTLLRCACRTLINAGDARVLKAFGLGQTLKGTVSVSVSPRRIRLGEAIELRVQLQSTTRRPQVLLIDDAVHRGKAARRTCGRCSRERPDRRRGRFRAGAD